MFDQLEYPSVDDSLELLRIRIADDPLPISIQTDCTSQIANAKECYNFSIEEDDDPQNINILESKGSRTIVGPTLDCPEITEKLKIKKVNIGIEEMSKIASIGNYWDDRTIGQVADLLQEYQDLFPMKFEDMKRILGVLGVMRIPLKEESKLVK